MIGFNMRRIEDGLIFCRKDFYWQFLDRGQRLVRFCQSLFTFDNVENFSQIYDAHKNA